jgi:hypothetical protein
VKEARFTRFSIFVAPDEDGEARPLAP